jgi:hypothetical protein
MIVNNSPWGVRMLRANLSNRIRVRFLLSRLREILHRDCVKHKISRSITPHIHSAWQPNCGICFFKLCGFMRVNLFDALQAITLICPYVRQQTQIIQTINGLQRVNIDIVGMNGFRGRFNTHLNLSISFWIAVRSSDV